MGWVMQDPRSPNIAKIAAERAGVPCTSPGTTFHGELRLRGRCDSQYRPSHHVG